MEAPWSWFCRLPPPGRGETPDGVLALVVLASAIVLLAGRGVRGPLWQRCVAARCVWLGLVYLALRHLPPAWVGGALDAAWSAFLPTLADAVFWGVLLWSAGDLWARRGDHALAHDLYLASLSGPWDVAMVGWRRVVLKAFFAPLMGGWAVGHAHLVLEQLGALPLASLDLPALNALVIELCLTLDAWIFTLGYLVESPRLGNTIRSVDPSPVAWIACLACYPPLNGGILEPLDGLGPVWGGLAADASMPRWLAEGAMTLLWGVFAWASLSLGARASNLTSRGVVARGPYRWVRHPAYAAKWLIWAMQCGVFGALRPALLLGLGAVYALRAWTEEHHLAATDPAYADYCRKVRWRFVPGVF